MAETTDGRGGRKRRGKPGGKVVHIDDALHDRIRRYCVDQDVRMKDWVSAVLTSILDGEYRTSTVPVRKKSVVKADEPTGDEPWSRPPFWQKA